MPRAWHTAIIFSIAAVTGGSTAEAACLINVGKATLDATTEEPEHRVPGQPEPPRLPVLAGAVNRGRLSIDAANVVSLALARLAAVADAQVLADAERHLVQRAQELPLDRLEAVIRQMEAALDATATALKEEARRGARYLNIF